MCLKTRCVKKWDALVLATLQYIAGVLCPWICTSYTSLPVHIQLTCLIGYKREHLAQPIVMERCKFLTEFMDECRHGLLIFKRNELSMELVIQLSVHLIMVLLSLTDYPLESGLQTLFQVRHGY